ncbi:MAG: ABC transporter permease [Bacillota bacterium]|jgi:spermidine/putrescine transport system permease protein|nr:ABC transporter permease [Bacillota bacterium]HHU42960.1 ABC transporter permease [Clostridiales bacterium]
MVKKTLSNAYILIIMALLYAPIILIIVFSFANTSNFTFRHGFTLEAYRSIFNFPQTPYLLDALKNTLFIAVVSSVVSTIMGSVAAIGIYNLKQRPRRIVENINQMPIINSEIVMAVALMLFFITFKFPQGYVRLIIGHISFCTPYVVLSVMPRLIQMDPNVYEAALDLGASPVKALFKVIIPIIFPGIMSGFAMAFTLSMDDFIITQINKGTTTGIDTLSTYIYSSQHNARGLNPFWFAVFSIIIVVVLALLLIINLNKLIKRINKERKNEKSF